MPDAADTTVELAPGAAPDFVAAHDSEASPETSSAVGRATGSAVRPTTGSHASAGTEAARAAHASAGTHAAAGRTSAPHATVGSASLGVGGSAGSVEALERDELRRTRWFCYVSFTISAVALVALLRLGGDHLATLLLAGALATSVAATGFMLYRSRDSVEFRKPSTALGWVIPAAATTMAIPYFGAFSPAAVVLVLGIYFTGLGKSGRLAWGVYVVCAAVQGVVGGLVIAGATRDTGLVHAGNLSIVQQIIVQALVQFVFATTLFVARMSRRTQRLALEELEREVRISAHREALLIEAREQLERALRPGRGKFSEQQIGGYALGAVLGRGAMGEVYEAIGPAGVVAIKLLSQASLGNANHVLRFLRELRTAAAIDSPHVVRVLEVGEQPVPYLVMERLDGQSLADVLRARRALPPDEVLTLIRHIGAGVTAAGAAGVIHRDLKPQNVFRHGEAWKLLDFGVARALDHGDTLTAGHIVGTPAYMAPEQASGGAIGHAADLYAVAAIAYRALTGHPLFATGDIAETLYKVVHAAPRRPTDLAPQLAPELDLVLAIGVAKQPADRFATADELVDALAAAIARQLPLSLHHRGFALIRAGAWSERRNRPRTTS